MTALHPGSEDEVASIIVELAAAGETVDIVGGGTRCGLGRPAIADHTLHLDGLRGITLYEPAELVMGARAGTSLAEIAATLGARGQMLPFEPMDHRPLLGTGGEPSIGGVFAANISGPRRVSAGAARDHFLGVTLINGRGQIVRNGGRVMKNVTGLDLVKLSAGAMGTLGVMTEVIFKVLPQPEVSATLRIRADDAVAAIDIMTQVMGSSTEVSAAAFLPGTGILLRIEGFAASVSERLDRLRDLVGNGDRLDADKALWAGIGDAALLAALPGEIWRVSVPPSKAPSVIAATRDFVTGMQLDWSGGLLWLASPAESGVEGVLRALCAHLKGHSTLVRASPERRTNVPVFQPLAEPLMRLTAGIKSSFDPAGMFNPGRMYWEL